MYVKSRISLNTEEGSLVEGYCELPTGWGGSECIYWCMRICVYKLVYTLVNCVYSMTQGGLADIAVPLYYCTPWLPISGVS